MKKAVFKLWLDLGPAPMQGRSAGYAVFPGAEPSMVASTLNRLRLIANSAERQVIMEHLSERYVKSRTNPESLWISRSPKRLLAVIYNSGIIVTAKESGVELSTNGSLILSVCDDGVGTLTFSFSRPVSNSSTIRLIAIGLPGSPQTTRSQPGAVSCESDGVNRTIIDLVVPTAFGRTASGQCHY